VLCIGNYTLLQFAEPSIDREGNIPYALGISLLVTEDHTKLTFHTLV
jgi:hypothetical protein